jgi:hypothetical protein
MPRATAGRYAQLAALAAETGRARGGGGKVVVVSLVTRERGGVV